MPTELAFHFDERRATQACAILLKQAGGRSNYTRILKLIYLADRKHIDATGNPITGATVVNMKNGPMLSEVYECIKGSRSSGVWDDHIANEGFDIRLTKPAGDSHISDLDVDILTELATRYADASYSTMIEVVHDLPEWSDPAPAKVVPVAPADLLSCSWVQREGH